MLAAAAADEKQAQDIKILDVRKITPITDFIVVCAGESGPQLKAISSNIEDKVRKKGLKCLRWEGKVNSNWFILDLGMVIVHVMGEGERQRYKLEEMWGKKGITYHL